MILVRAAAAKNTKNVMELPKSAPMLHNKKLNEKQLGLIEKIIAFLGGLFLGAFIMTILLKIFSSYWGVFVGLMLNTGIAIFILKKEHLKAEMKIAAYGVLSSVVGTIVLAAVLWSVVQVMFAGIAN